MVTNAAKETACRTHHELLKVIHELGQGIMFSKHILSYMAHFKGYNKPKVWRNLRELQERDIIEIKKYHNSNYVMLKKYALRYFKQLEGFELVQSKDISSLVFSEALLKRSLFINQYILDKLLKDKGLDDFITYIKKTTTLLSKRNNSYSILENNLDKTKNILDEIENLKVIQENQKNLLGTGTGQVVKKNSQFNLNNMQSRNIYFLTWNQEKIIVLIFDINNNFTSKKLIRDISDTYNYIYQLQTTSKQPYLNQEVTFNIVVAKEAYKKRIAGDKNNLIKGLGPIYSQIKLGITNLEVEKKCFSNVKILF